MYEAVMEGTRDPSLAEVTVVGSAALHAGPSAVLESDAVLLGTPANIGYMSGALKHFFDQIYYPCLEVTKGRPYGLYVHGNNDTDGAVRAIDAITTGLKWRRAQPVVSVIGQPASSDLDACRELGAAMAAALLLESS